MSLAIKQVFFFHNIGFYCAFMVCLGKYLLIVMIDFNITSAELFPFFIALALWALVWCEREVSYRMRGDKQEEEDDQFGGRAFAGTRSFALIALFGWLMGFFSSIDVAGGFLAIAIGFFALVIMIAIVEWYAVFIRRQPGITTTISLFLTYFLGVLSVVDSGKYQAIATVIAIALTMILATKKHIRSFFDQIDHYELLDGLKFAVILFIILPLLPYKDALWETIYYGASPINEAFFNPYSTWKFVVIMTGIWYIGYLLKKIVGNAGGIQISGIIGGLISSTAVTSAMAQASRDDPHNPYPYLTATLLANAVMFIRVVIVVALFYMPVLTGYLIYPMSASIIIALVSCVFFLKIARKNEKNITQKKDQDEDEKSPFQIIPALKFAWLLIGIQWIVAVVQHFSGNLSGQLANYANYIVSFVAGFTDVDAITTTMTNTAQKWEIAIPVAWISIFLAVVANTITKIFLATSFASRPFKVGLVSVCGVIISVGLLTMFLVSNFLLI